MSAERKVGRVALMIFASWCFATPHLVFPAEKVVTVEYRIFPGLAEMDGN